MKILETEEMNVDLRYIDLGFWFSFNYYLIITTIMYFYLFAHNICFIVCVCVCMCVCERAYQLYCVSLSSLPRIAVLTAGYKGLFTTVK